MKQKFFLFSCPITKHYKNFEKMRIFIKKFTKIIKQFNNKGKSIMSIANNKSIQKFENEKTKNSIK
jgi:hypothetical protein